MLAYHLLALSTCTPQQIKTARDITGKAWVDGTWDPCVAAVLLSPYKRGPKVKGAQCVRHNVHPLLRKDPDMPSTLIGTFSRQDVMRMRRRLKQWIAKPDYVAPNPKRFPAGKDTGFTWMGAHIVYQTKWLQSLLAMFNTVLERGSTVTLNYYGA